MRYFSTFTGIGGFELGIQQAYEIKKDKELPQPLNRESVGVVGHDRDKSMRESGMGSRRGTHPVCIGYSEIDKYAIQIYQKHFPNHKNYGDIKLINEKELPEFDLFVGGFPCQSFSIAGKRGGFNDTRGTLFFDIARILKVKQPHLLLLENVKGLLSHDEGRTFATIITTLDELGYDLQWQVLNSKNHRVPQNRERVFIIGHLRGTSRPEVFPFQRDSIPIATVAGYISEEDWSGRHEQIRRTYNVDGAMPTIPTGQGGGVMTKFLKDGLIRRLTPTECERLQGFPDGWTEGLSDTQRYKTLGNAVTVNVIRDIMEKLLSANN